MASSARVDVGCLLVGEYVDEAEVPANFPSHPGEVVRPRVVASYLDLWSKEEGIKEFSVLLRNSRVLTVRGHGLKYVQNPSNPADSGSYAIVEHATSGEVTVGLFPVSEVTGIFRGEMRLSRDSA